MVPNAFATGRSPDHSVIAVTRGLLNELEPKEVEAVLAHELSHVAHRDVTVMTVAGVTGVVASLMMRAFLFSGGRRGGNNNGVPIQLLLMLVGVVVYALSFLLIRVLSRYRELAADRAAAMLTGSPSTLASALVKISGQTQKMPQQDLRQSAGAAHLAFFNVGSLFSTHPSLEKRLAQLEKISRQLSTEL
jgi:heat shock protein HtpX